MFERSANKGGKERVGLQGFGFEFGMKLATEKPGMVRKLDDLHQVRILEDPGNDHTLFHQTTPY